MLVLQGVLVYILYHVSSHEICENELLLKIFEVLSMAIFSPSSGIWFSFFLKNWISQNLQLGGCQNPLRYKLFICMKGTWLSQEVSKRLGSVGCNPNILHL